MRSCPYCKQPATAEIPSTPSHVCLTHAIEYWTDLLAHVKARSIEFQVSQPHPSDPISLSARRDAA